MKILDLDYETFKKWANDITNVEINYELKLPDEWYDENGYIVIKHTLQAYHILQVKPDAKIRSDDEEIQARIDAYYNSKHPNLMIFASPTQKEFEKEFKTKE